MSEIIEKELSYRLVGILFGVHGELGGGYQEKYYQRAVAAALKKENIEFKEQVMVPLSFLDAPIGRYFLDFLIEKRSCLKSKLSKEFFRATSDKCLPI